MPKFLSISKGEIAATTFSPVLQYAYKGRFTRSARHMESNLDSESNNLAVPSAMNNLMARGAITIAYNKRNSFFSRPDLIARQRN
jgi:hypothetical protein